MIKFKHLLALSMTAAFAANASADALIGESKTFDITGSILPPTCVVQVDETIKLQDVTVNAFKAIGATAGEVQFELKLVESETKTACPTISRVAGSQGDTTPSVNIFAATDVVGEGYLANSKYENEETQSIAVQLLNGKNALTLSKDSAISIKADENAVVALTARYIALTEKVDVQNVQASFKVDVEYK